MTRSLFPVLASAIFFVGCTDPTEPPGGNPSDGGTSSPWTSPDADLTPCLEDPSRQVPASFSACAGCHDAFGRPRETGPNLFEHADDYEAFSRAVRTGPDEMPAFSEEELSVGELGAIFDYFAAGPPRLREDCGVEVDGSMPPIGGPTCPPSFEPLAPTFAPSEVRPIVTRRDDGVIVTRVAGRVRNRHELEGTFNTFGPLYFENRWFELVFEDHVGAGEDRIEVTWRPVAMPSTFGPKTNVRYWKINGNGNVFYRNTDLTSVGPREQVHTVRGNAREEREMRVGDVLEIEFGIFFAGQDGRDPAPIEGRTSYYSDTFRYQVGVGGLTSENTDPSGQLGPSEDARLVGDLTIPWLYEDREHALGQLALHAQPEHVSTWLEGRRLFRTDFGNGEHSEPGNPVLSSASGLLGPHFNTNNCVSCHQNDARSVLPAPGEVLRTVAVKSYGGDYGSQLQPTEAEVRLERFDEERVMLADGTEVTLRRPVLAVPDLGDTRVSVRVARQLVGLGLIEAIPEEAVLARADPEDCDGDGISGRPQIVQDPRDGARRLGRFGWKAEKVDVAHQVADALQADFGVSTSIFPEDGGSFELSDEDVGRLATYLRLLGLPGQRNPNDAQVQAGERVFHEVGCVNCHAPSAHTDASHPFAELRDQEIRPYSDLLLHDLGPNLDDGSGTPYAREWRTPPLWGIGMLETVMASPTFLHDGRARSLLEAVLWHGGEAAAVQARVVALGTEEREALLAFLRSL
ncbi:MAG: c-type cytochrome [Sandaracinus sp.]|nr:c-type cytochrome [Sandaracinus sp.]MCB9620069.1 c-type cytochrome [Sandaracinus sp.]MCB9631926.1 c-type cytochrome [Sandaracinus sp.]